MIWRIELKEKPGIFDAAGANTLKDIQDLGIRSVDHVEVIQVFILEGDLNEEQVRTICTDLLVDPVTHQFTFSSKPKKNNDTPTRHTVEIAYNPGVMDPVEASTIKGIRDLGFDGIRAVRTARKFIISGKLTGKQLNLISDKILMNKLIQHRVAKPEDQFKHMSLGSQSTKFELVMVPLRAASDKELMEISQKGQLYLNLNEMKAIRAHFRSIDRDPTDIELETVAQTWSEHCHHKTFRGIIRYQYIEKGKKKSRLIKSLLKSTIVKATYELNKPWCVSVFHDNAGIIAFDDEYNVCFKVETHNHPSALEPFGGSNTGVGGVIRDTLGTGLGAKPICNTDVFCFAQPDFPAKDLPAGTLHPKRVMKGVVSGVRDYGNKMGIPTLNGAIVFDRGFVGNPLVFCGNVGLIPKGKEFKKSKTGDLIVVVGGRTGRDGIHGATFSSGELTDESEVVSSGAVQIGNPIEEKKVLDVLLQARDLGLYTAITDCGAGGLSSAVGEMGAELGARVDLEKAPLKYKGLRYTEIWISESQERMVMSVPQNKIDELLAIFQAEGVEATVIGEFTDTKRLQLLYEGAEVCDLDMNFLHDGIPKITKEAVYTPAKHKEPKIAKIADLTKTLFDVMGHYNVSSKETVVRQYDHEVQGGSVVKPFVGIHADGPSDAAVVMPRLGSYKGIAVSNGINIRFGKIDPFWMAASCIDEAIRQIIAVGGNLKQIAILDNFCWGNPDKPDRLGGLVRAAEGCYKAAVGFGTPFISGKDSLYNEYTEKGKALPIPGTILISAIGVMKDVRHAVTMDFKKGGNAIYAVGKTKAELGGSIYYDTLDAVGAGVPTVDFKTAVKTFNALSDAIADKLVVSAHDCSEGGIAAALAEMAFSGGLGVTAFCQHIPFEGTPKRDDVVLFSESNSRFIVEIPPDKERAFIAAMKGVAIAKIGQVEDSPEFVIYGLKNNVVVNAYIDDLKAAWQAPLNF